MIHTFTLLTVMAAPPSPLEAKNRPYDVQHYKIELRQADGATFNNVVSATIKPGKALTEVELDAYDLKISSAKVDGEPAEFKEKYDPATRTGTLTLKLKKPLAANKDAVVEIAYAVTAGTTNQGLFTSTEPDLPNALPGYFTHFEPNFAQRFMPLNDTPADKATSEVLAVVKNEYSVVSNGRKEKDEAFTEGGQNLRRVHWKQDVAHSPYLIAIAIGQFEQVPVTDDIPSTIWVPAGQKDRAFVAADVLKQLYNFQVGAVGTKYPWAKLDVVAVPRFYWNGMENTSVIFERTSKLLVDHRNDQLARSQIVALLSHEMAHQYFGDFTTCANWNEVWLNEGFATWLGNATWDDYNGSDHDEVEVRTATRLLDGYFAQEDGPHAHPLVVKGLPGEQAFDSTSYTKGANVLRMLELWLGKAEMKKVLKAWFEKHGGKAVTSDDFFKVVFETTKKEKELKPFKDAWLNRKGYPVVFIDTSFSGGKLQVTLRQQPNHASEKGPFVFKLPISIHRATEPSFKKDEIITVDKAEVKVTLDVPAAPEWVNWNKNFGALVKIDEASIGESQWVDAARNDPDPVWRLIAARHLLGEIGNPTPKEEVRPTELALNAVLDVLTKDPSPYVREALLERMAGTRFRKLPAEFSAPIYALAKRPENLTEDPAGYIRVRNAALSALARCDSPEGHRYILDELSKRELDINYVEAFATAAARLGTPSALGQLGAALVNQKGRGAGYYRRTVAALGTATTIDILPMLRDTLKANPTNNELARAIIDNLRRNRELREAKDYASLVRSLALDEAFNEELRHDLVTTLDDVKYEPAKLALTEIVEKTKSEGIKGWAKRTLDANFPAPPPTKEEKPGKGGKKK